MYIPQIYRGIDTCTYTQYIPSEQIPEKITNLWPYVSISIYWNMEDVIFLLPETRTWRKEHVNCRAVGMGNISESYRPIRFMNNLQFTAQLFLSMKPHFCTPPQSFKMKTRPNIFFHYTCAETYFQTLIKVQCFKKAQLQSMLLVIWSIVYQEVAMQGQNEVRPQSHTEKNSAVGFGFLRYQIFSSWVQHIIFYHSYRSAGKRVYTCTP